ncbi:hypothetical protein EVAR_75386_1 [Eumeta japonica]|uniref:Uncharacterized protein n=1 Tax=Eumeta variegata TaxID=151549 RepID=A0A4C1TMF3_EUMVA|nr:hypothetical protein EVAR_75386_1 [Eumeta japonica]
MLPRHGPRAARRAVGGPARPVPGGRPAEEFVTFTNLIVVHINGEQISLVGEIRLLGLTIDRKLTFIPNVAKACKKATNIYKGLA